MKVETKFDVGESVFIILNNRVQVHEIKKVEIIIAKDIKIYYSFADIRLLEKKLFKTIDELKDDLTKDIITIDGHDPFKMI
jgi:transcription elongation factor